MMNTETLAALIEEKQILEKNMRFLANEELAVFISRPGSNEYLSMPKDEHEAILKTVTTKRQQRLDDINALFETIDNKLKELSDNAGDA
ncbi:hypothetical protein D3C71_234650 [compost metagenome]